MTPFPYKNDLFRIILIILLFIGNSAPSFAADNNEDESFDVSGVIIHHVLDDHIWHFWDGHYGTLYLPVIVYSAERGFDVFSSSNFYDENHNLIPYNGYKLEHNHIYLGDTQVLDFSITKNVVMLFITAFILILVFRAVAKGARKNAGKAPKGIQSFMEPIILFVTEEVIKPNAGPKANKYVPYLLTLFFFYTFWKFIGTVAGCC